MPLYSYYCEVCNNTFEKFRSIVQRREVYCCNQKAVKLFSRINTHKDRGYSFTTEMFNGKPIEVRSKQHYKNLLKQHGIADASPKECFQQAEKCRKNNEISREISIRKRAKRLADKMVKENVNHVAKDAIGKLIKGGKEVKSYA